MRKFFNIRTLEVLCKDFYTATGVAIHIMDEGFIWIDYDSPKCNYCELVQSTKQGAEKCRFCDAILMSKCKEAKAPISHICHAGLVDAIVPIMQGEIIIGYIIMGQMKHDNDFSVAEKGVSKLSGDVDKFRKYYDKLPLFNDDKIKSSINLAQILSAHISRENIIRKVYLKNIEKVIMYISDNIGEKMTIENIAEGTQLSKSALYKMFRSYFNCTVGEYTNRKRIESSVELLLQTDLSIEEISEKVGFSSASHYSKIFKNINGLSPLKFKKEMEEKNKI